MMLNRMYETPIVVIIAAVPRTPRSGRSDRRSIATPRMPAPSIVTAREKTNPPASAGPALTRDAQKLEGPHAEKRADHEHIEMREIDQLENAVDQGKSQRQQGIHRAEAQPVDHLLQQHAIVGHHGAPGGSEYRLVIRHSRECGNPGPQHATG